MSSRIIKNFLLIGFFSILLGCKYLPYAKYQFQKKNTHLPSFNGKDYLVGSQNSLRTAYDLTMYDWYVKPDPETQTIEGVMKIEFLGMEAEKTILLDLQKKLKIDELTSSFPISNFEHKNDLLYVHFDKPLITGERVHLTIKYHGKPVIISNEGPIQWRKDKNDKDWISTQTEGIGAHYMMPCKLPLYDEPERTFIRVEVAKDLVVVANGNLDSITEKSDSKIYHHSVHNPINIYCISFNIGDFVKLEKAYTDINGIDRTIEVFPLSNDKEKADTFYNDAPLFMDHLEELFGEFPWWNDGCKIVQSTLGRSAMEHQSAISMGSIYYYDYVPPNKKHINTTVIHELAHEWWGNAISAQDYCDMWIHEGMATYAELLVIEKVYNEIYYDWSANMLVRFTDNNRPVIKECDVLYNSWVHDRDQNIYYKGALLLHTLRRQLDNDSLFLKVFNDASIFFSKQNITSTQLESYFNEAFKQDFTWLFDMYLRETKVPTLAFYHDTISQKVYYQWQSSAENQEKLKVYIRPATGDLIALSPSNAVQSIEITEGEKPLFEVSNSGYIQFKELKKMDKKNL